ncbi:PQQ-binding-like beta-propeller repeat protein [Haloarculaceae archaeon H-GB1-1]|nr:PQQ-binding-like beta-propeller repeat protein [Haloarculaceae archaeon H-GB1-1]
MVGRNPGHTREGAPTPADPQTVWITELDQGRTTGTPALVDDRLYVPVDAISDTARDRYRIHALTAATGEERWKVPLRSEPNSPPAVSGDRIVVTARRSLERGRIVCFQTRYGEEEWLVDVDARLTAPPTIHGGVVYVPDWRGRVHALSASDGSVLWSRHVNADGSSRTFPEPVAVLDETLYVGSQSGKTGVIALDATTGERLWTESTHAVTSGPVAHRNGIIVQSHEDVIAFETDGSRRWSFNVLEGTARPIAADDRHVYVAARDSLYAITWNGDEVWVYDSSEERIGTPTIAGDTVIVRGEDYLTALSRSDGTEQWTATPQGVGRAVIVPEAIFLSGADGNVIALGEA